MAYESLGTARPQQQKCLEPGGLVPMFITSRETPQVVWVLIMSMDLYGLRPGQRGLCAAAVVQMDTA